MHTPEITIAVPILNEVKFIEQALDSLERQTYRNLKVIIVDGGSTDGTIDLLKKFNYEIHVIPGLGQMASINQVWKNCNSKYVTWMAGDDILYENAFHDLVSELESNPKSAFAHGPADVIDAFGNIIFKRNASNIGTNELLRSFCMLPQTGLIRRELLQKSGYTNPKLRFAADHDLYLRLSFFGFGVAAKRPIAKFRIHEESEDAQNFANVGRQTIGVIEDIINSDLGKLFLDKKQIKIGRSHSRIVAANFIICSSMRYEAFINLLNAAIIDPKIIIDIKSIKLVCRLLLPIQVPPNFYRKIMNFLS